MFCPTWFGHPAVRLMREVAVIMKFKYYFGEDYLSAANWGWEPP